MQSNVLPNDWISNAVLLCAVPLMTTVVMRIKNSMCTNMPKLRTHYAVDLFNMIAVNYVAMASAVLYCTMLPTDLESLIALDLVLGVPIERWLLKVFSNLNTAVYHPTGPLGRTMMHQRLRVSLVMATLARGYVVAVRMVLPPSHHTAPTELEVAVLVPLIYTLIRTLALDVFVGHVNARSRVQLNETTNSAFTIASEDEDDEEQGQPSADNPVDDTDITAL